MDSAAPRPDDGTFSLLETMRLEAGEVKRLDRHLSRMAAAAGRFGYPWREAEVRAVVAATAAAHAAGHWRLRLLLAGDGTATIERTPLTREAAAPWKLAFAREPVDAADPFILHKTTRRIVHEAARRSRPEADEVLLWNARGEVTEGTIGNLVAEIGGVRCTPPLSSGLLAGTFRAEQLEAGRIRERVLTKADVSAARRLWLINSVREWIESELMG